VIDGGAEAVMPMGFAFVAAVGGGLQVDRSSASMTSARARSPIAMSWTLGTDSGAGRDTQMSRPAAKKFVMSRRCHDL